MSSNEKKPTDSEKSSANCPSDLDELLDDALKDFNNVEHPEQSSSAASANIGIEDPNSFFMEQVKFFDEQMKDLMGQPEPGEELLNEHIMTGFKKMAEATAVAIQGETSADDDEVKKYSDSITQAIKGMREASGSLQTGISEGDVAKLFSGLDLDESIESDDNPFLPFMEGMMQSLLSPEILLPGISATLERYEKYLEEDADKISPSDKEIFDKHIELFKSIRDRLQSQKPDETPSEKRANRKLIMEEMRKLSEYGKPPKEIFGLPDVLNLDAEAASNQQCPMM